MDMVRLNISHGTQEWHSNTIRAIRSVEKLRQTPIPILLDLQGPRIRIGSLPKTGIVLHTGQSVKLTPTNAGESRLSTPSKNQPPVIPVVFPSLTKDVKKGNKILINDGLIELFVNKVTTTGLDCSVVVGGKVTSRKGVNFPDTNLSGPALTKKDLKDLLFGLETRVDYIALSFVRSAQDIRAVKTFLLKHKQDIPVIAKIERPEAILRLNSILDQADGVMLARGDLAIEMSLEAVPILQKQVIAEANRRHRLVITATQMLESMTEHPRPTRAEASDVANAVLDGSDVLMLSAETSAGQYPIQTVQIMARIIRTAEKGTVLRWEPTKTDQKINASVTASACIAADSAARHTQAKAIVVFTDSGATALLMSKQRPSVLIIALTPSGVSQKRMAAYWGVQAYLMPQISNTDERIQQAEDIVKQHGLIHSKDRIVILSGEHAQKPTGTNLIKIHLVK
jgi:pyruvate kinase